MTPTIFIKPINGKLILWNYSKHEQFEIDITHLARIVELTAGSTPTESSVDLEILKSGCLDELDPTEWGWDCLSRIFHLGTQIGIKPGEQLPKDDAYRGYLEYCASIEKNIPELHVEKPGETIQLPVADLENLGNASFQQVLKTRQTCRSFDASPLSLQEVSMALWATFGTVHGMTRNDLEAEGLMPVGYRRTSPSGGSLHPSEAYLVAIRVEGLLPGIYHYRSHKHELSVIQPFFDQSSLGSLLCSQTFANDLAYGIFVTSIFEKMWWKYPHSRAYRVSLLDIGCLPQTFQLVCAAQNIQSWPTGYFIDHEINKLLNLDSSRESVMFFLGAGHGSGSIAREVLQILDEMRNTK